MSELTKSTHHHCSFSLLARSATAFVGLLSLVLLVGRDPTAIQLPDYGEPGQSGATWTLGLSILGPSVLIWLLTFAIDGRWYLWARIFGHIGFCVAYLVVSAQDLRDESCYPEYCYLLGFWAPIVDLAITLGVALVGVVICQWKRNRPGSVRPGSPRAPL
jgi:hypothetical protein